MSFRKSIFDSSQEHRDGITGCLADWEARCARPAVSLLTFIVFLIAANSLRASENPPVELPEPVQTFFDLNCYECHNSVDQKGELDLESLNFNPSDHSSMNLWALIHDRVRDEEMPPPEDSLVEPGERSEFLASFENLLHETSRRRIAAEGRVKARRLSRIEYQNTIHDVLGVNIPILDLLPEDTNAEGFSNIAAEQQLSYHLLEKYLAGIDIMLEAAFQRAIHPPAIANAPLSNDLVTVEIQNKLPHRMNFDGRKVFLTTDNKTYRYEAGWVVDSSTLDLEGTTARNTEIAEYLETVPYKRHYKPSELGVGLERHYDERVGILYNDKLLTYRTFQGYHGRMPVTTVPIDGWYRIHVLAQAHNPPGARPVWARILSGRMEEKAPATYWVGKVEATRKMREFTFDAWIEKDHMLRIQPGDKTVPEVKVPDIRDKSVLESPATGVAIGGIRMERIYPGLNNEELRKRIFGNLAIVDEELISEQPERDLKRLLESFAKRAFRRPVKPSELRPYFKFAINKLESTGSLREALRAGYRSILSSHRFLYFTEEPGTLDDYSIASRLSYLLWSGPPDEELLEKAGDGKLSSPKHLKAQAERMLDDPKAESFVRNFADSWLELRDINFTTPDSKLYPKFDDILLYSMLDETYAFLGNMIKEDLSVTNVIDSDFTLLNERLAQHYGLDFDHQNGLRKIALNEKQNRGGLITQASVLKVTANGTTTSPIVRGVWLIERILGQHISPPPDQVPAIEPDIRGATSIREQLDKHRSSESCMACHKKIDPPGFALENYDVIGGWREHYRIMDPDKLDALNKVVDANFTLPEKLWMDGPAVDASYQLPDGKTFRNINDFKKVILAHPDQIARNLVHQVLTYATGAEIQFADRREIDAIVAELADDYGFRSLIHAVTQSDVFLSK